MTETRQRILELFETMAPAERRGLVEELVERSEADAGFGRLTPEQIAKIDEGIAQAERGNTVPAEEAFDRLAKRFGFSNA
jgi:predicted transcriptional regulator